MRGELVALTVVLLLLLSPLQDIGDFSWSIVPQRPMRRTVIAT